MTKRARGFRVVAYTLLVISTRESVTVKAMKYIKELLMHWSLDFSLSISRGAVGECLVQLLQTFSTSPPVKCHSEPTWEYSSNISRKMWNWITPLYLRMKDADKEVHLERQRDSRALD